MPAARRPLSFGWIPDYPDFRDYTAATGSVRELLTSPPALDAAKIKPAAKRPASGARPARPARTKSAPASVDLREWCSPVEDQGGLGSCTANAGVGVIEYYERKAFGRHLDASRLFLYKVTRNLMKMKGDTGAYLRKTMSGMVLFGVPPEEYWAYTDAADAFDKEPPAFCYAFAQNFQTIRYYRHDPPGTSPKILLGRIKSHLAAGHPSMFGFTIYASIENVDARGAIPFPGPSERILGGHAIVAVGYDDAVTIKGKGSAAGPETKGALLIRNSWSEGWGDGGYGWLPYAYIERGLAEDFWSILKKEWVDTGCFALPDEDLNGVSG